MENDERLVNGLKEVELYRKLSAEKNESQYADKDPEYYIKMQDVLVALLDDFPTDYRLLWEMCKPVDFDCPCATNSNYSINSYYFENAIKYAPMEEKERLIREKEQYENVKEEEKRRRAEIEEERMRKVREEQEARQRAVAEQEAEQRRIAAEREEEFRRQRKEERTERLPGNISLITMILAWPGLFAFLLPGIVLAIVSIVFGIKGLKASNKGQAIAGMVGSILLIIAIILLIIMAFMLE